ncbi:MAG: type II toxin-antitoxin system VapC family toxin [Spirochaetota bacterium]
MKFVIDCSFSSALFLPDEKSDSIRTFFINLKDSDQIYIPLLWWYESINVLNVSLKRKRLNFNAISKIIELFDKMPIETDISYGSHYSKNIFELTQLYKISAYDAAYIELAVRKKAKLMTLDKDLIKASEIVGV